MSHKQTIKEAFIFELTLNEAVGKSGNRIISGEAIHPIKTHHPNDWVKTRQYIEPYLEKAAPTLVGKPLLLNHEGKPLEGCTVIEAIYDREKSALVYKAEVTPEIARMIETGEVKHVSVGIDWMRPGGGVLVTEEGMLPYGFSFSHLALVGEGYEAGDPLASVHLWECLVVEAIKTPTNRKLQ